MTATFTDFPRPTLGSLILDDHLFLFRGPVTGLGRLRVWTADEGGFVAVVTDSDLGVSAKNAAEDIWRIVTSKLATTNVVLFDYTPYSWRPALDWWWWDTPDHHTVSTIWADEDIEPGTEPDAQQDWAREYGPRLRDEGGPWNLPARLRSWFQQQVTEQNFPALNELYDGTRSLH